MQDIDSQDGLSGMKRTRQARFETLVDDFSRDLYRYALFLSSDPSVSDDLVQETFLRAWRAFDSLNCEASAKGWLFTILRRENARRFERQRPETGQIETDGVPDWNNYDTSVEAVVLRRAVRELAPEYREPLLLQVIAGFSCDEIAEVLDLSRSAVMTRVSRARKKLRAVLEDGVSEKYGKVTA